MMSATRPLRKGLLFLALLLGALGSIRAIPPEAVSSWLTATQAYLRQDYAAAHAEFARVLQAELTPAEREKLLWQNADCLRRLDRPDEAAIVLESLIKVAPDSPYLLQGRPLLYQYYLAAGKTEQAEALWRDALPHLRGTSYFWELLTPRLVALARTNPDRLVAQAEVIVEAKPSATTLTMSVYRPLYAARRLAEVPLLHARLQVLFTEKAPALADLDQQAYDDALTRNYVETLITDCRNAIDAGNWEMARYWLVTINTNLPEYPRTAEINAYYNEKAQAMRKDKPGAAEEK